MTDSIVYLYSRPREVAPRGIGIRFTDHFGHERA